MNKKQFWVAAGFLVCAGRLSAADITGKPIFDDKPSRTAKAEKAVAEGDALANEELKQATLKHLRAQIRARTRAMDILNAEASLAARANDKDGLASIEYEKKRFAGQLEDLKAKLHAEDREAPPEPVVPKVPGPGTVEGPAKEAPLPPAKEENPDAPAPEAAKPDFKIAPAEIPALMIGKWKCVENGHLTGYYILQSNGVVRTFKKLNVEGKFEHATGTWKVWADGNVSLVNDDDGGNDMLRVGLVSGNKASGTHQLRKSDAETYKPGGKLELVREDK